MTMASKSNFFSVPACLAAKHLLHIVGLTRTEEAIVLQLTQECPAGVCSWSQEF